MCPNATAWSSCTTLLRVMSLACGFDRSTNEISTSSSLPSACRIKSPLVRRHTRQFNAAQKKEVLQAVDEQIQVIVAMRKEGRAFTDTVKPLVPRIKTILLENSNSR
jgi:hypothetical protein